MKTIIYGVGAYGTLTQKILKKKNIEVDYFMDRKADGRMINGIEVISPDSVREHRADCFYISSKNYYGEIKEFLQENKCQNVHNICGLLETDMNDTELTEKERDMLENRKTYNAVIRMNDLEGIKIPHIEAVVTQCCNLKCRDCSNLMPYYSSPRNMETEQLIKWIHNLLETVSYIGELRIIGGEPFINKEIDKFINIFSDNAKIGIISVFTNGTILPEEKILRSLKANNVILHISDYGLGRETRLLLVEKCRQLHISFYVRKYDEWIQFGNMEYVDEDKKGLEKKYKYCSSANCLTVLNGKLYRCARAAHAYEIGLVPCGRDEYVDLSDKININRLEKYLYNKKYLEACKYCLGTNENDKTVHPAEQLK